MRHHSGMQDRRAAVDARAACPLGDGDRPVATFLGRSHPGLGQILASGRLAGHTSTGAPICYCLAARQQDCFPVVCAQTCGSLVRNGAEPVHKQWKCWGFRCLAETITGPLPGRARVASCACRENWNYPHATPQYIINEPNVYRKLISLLFGVGIVKTLSPHTVSRGALKGERKRHGGKHLRETLGAR
jgi:hypothetical protein